MRHDKDFKPFTTNTRLAIVSVIALLLIYHITRPLWLYCQYSCFIDMSIKFCIDFIILLMAWKGANQNRIKRNQYILLILIFYFIGDMITSFSPIPAAVPYAAGHILLVYCISNTCLIKKWQYLTVIVLALVLIPVIIQISHMLPDVTLILCLIAFLYGLILIVKFSLSLTNRFFRYAAILFLIGDTFGFLRITIYTQLTPVIDYTAYVTAILFYGLSTYNCSRKEVVCFSDVTVLCKALAKEGITYFIFGKWSKNIFLHRFLQQSEQIGIIYSKDQSGVIDDALRTLQYRDECIMPANARRLYSEKLGYLYIKEATILPDNSIVYSSEKDNKYLLDSGFVHTMKKGKVTYPCIFPIDENDQCLKPFQEE